LAFVQHVPRDDVALHRLVLIVRDDEEGACIAQQMLERRARPRIAERLVLERHDAIEVVGCGEAKVYAIAGIETRILRKLDGRPHAVTLRSTCGHGFLPTAAA